MVKILVVLLAFAWSGDNYAAPEQNDLVISSEELEDISQKDGKGCYWEILEVIFKDTGIRLKKINLPYSQAVKRVRKNKLDAVMGTYEDEFDKAVFSAQGFDKDVIHAVFRKGFVKDWKQQDSLSGKVAWIRGYEYDAYLKKKVDFKEVSKRKQALVMLKKGRIDFFLDPKEDLENALQKNYVDRKELEVKTVLELQLYIAFTENERGKYFKKVFDEQLAKAIKDKDQPLKKVFDKWGVDYPY